MVKLREYFLIISRNRPDSREEKRYHVIFEEVGRVPVPKYSRTNMTTDKLISSADNALQSRNKNILYFNNKSQQLDVVEAAS